MNSKNTKSYNLNSVILWQSIFPLRYQSGIEGRRSTRVGEGGMWFLMTKVINSLKLRQHSLAL